MSSSEAQTGHRPSPEAIAILCERLQRMGVSMSEPAARSLLEAVLAVEGPRLDAQARANLHLSLDLIRKAADAAWRSLTGSPAGPPRRDYELSFPPVSEPPVNVSGPRRRVSAPRQVRREEPERTDDDDEPRPVFKRRRGR